MNPPAYALLACEVFVDEIAALAGEPAPWRAAAWLEMGLHDHPDRLRAAIQTSITGLEADPQVEAIALAYGRCGNGLLGVRAGRVPLVLPQAHDCISILLGGVDRHNALLRENPGTYFCSPGWVREKRVPGPDRETYLRTLYGERYGDNVLTRIQYAIDRDGAGATLQSILLRGSLAPLLDQLLANAQLGSESLSECVATGNTVMLHTLAGAALDGFAAYPFKPAFLDAREFRSGDLGLPGDFPIRLAPHFGPFVGADILAGALASGLTRETGSALLIDFGTNGEILLKTRDGYLAHAMAVGLLPSVPRQRIRVIGNASLAGASLLLQANVADDVAALRSTCRVLELNQIESFEDHYIDAMALESG